jgi:hypothetical protein
MQKLSSEQHDAIRQAAAKHPLKPYSTENTESPHVSFTDADGVTRIALIVSPQRGSGWSTSFDPDFADLPEGKISYASAVNFALFHPVLIDLLTTRHLLTNRQELNRNAQEALDALSVLTGLEDNDYCLPSSWSWSDVEIQWVEAGEAFDVIEVGDGSELLITKASLSKVAPIL